MHLWQTSVLIAEVPWLSIHHAEGADPLPVWRLDRVAGVEPHARVARRDGVVGVPGIELRVLDDEVRGSSDGDVTERLISSQFDRLDAAGGLHELLIALDQRDRGDARPVPYGSATTD